MSVYTCALCGHKTDNVRNTYWSIKFQRRVCVNANTCRDRRSKLAEESK